MTDRDFLMWIHKRLERVHGYDRLLDNMHRLRDIIIATPKDQHSSGKSTFNSLEDLQEYLNDREMMRPCTFVPCSPGPSNARKFTCLDKRPQAI